MYFVKHTYRKMFQITVVIEIVFIFYIICIKFCTMEKW